MDAQKEWPSILEFQTGETVTVRLVEQRYRQLAKKYHPDAGGSDEDMQQLNLAKLLALKWIENERNRQEQARRVAAQVAAAQRGIQQLNQSYAYQQQQMADWAQSMYAKSYAAAGAYHSSAQEQQPPEQKVSQPEIRWWRRMFGRWRHPD